jgi:hypothetical protein
MRLAGLKSLIQDADSLKILRFLNCAAIGIGILIHINNGMLISFMSPLIQTLCVHIQFGRLMVQWNDLFDIGLYSNSST